MNADDLAASTLLPLAPGCAADSLDRASLIRIAGVSNGSVLRRAPNSDQPLRIMLRALGARANVQWLLNGRLQGSSTGADARAITLGQAGTYRITALASDGAFATLMLRVANAGLRPAQCPNNRQPASLCETSRFKLTPDSAA